MFRTIVSTGIMLTLAVLPTALSTHGIGPGGERGGSIDPNGLTVATCELPGHGERDGAINPEGLVEASAFRLA